MCHLIPPAFNDKTKVFFRYHNHARSSCAAEEHVFEVAKNPTASHHRHNQIKELLFFAQCFEPLFKIFHRIHLLLNNYASSAVLMDSIPYISELPNTSTSLSVPSPKTCVSELNFSIIPISSSLPLLTASNGEPDAP